MNLWVLINLLLSGRLGKTDRRERHVAGVFNKTLIPSVLLLFSVCFDNSCAQTIYWARILPTRELWINGRDLHVGSEHPQPGQEPPAAWIGDTPLTFDRLAGSSGLDANRGLSYCQRFLIPASVPAGESTLRWRRVDGKEITRPITVPAVVALCSFPSVNSRMIVDTPITVANGQTLNLDGRVVLPSPAFTAQNLIILGDGARLTNGGVCVPESSSAVTAVRLTGKGHIIDGVKIQNRKDKGNAFHIGSTTDSVFSDVEIEADHFVNAEPNDQHERNSFVRVSCSGPRGCNDSGGGRGLFAHQSLLLWCRWGECDRGPTGSPWGTALSQILLFECDQHNTGQTVGASEGTLLEAMEAHRCDALVAGTTVAIQTALLPADARFIRVGMYVADRTGQVYGRIVSKTDQPPATIFGMDRDLGPPRLIKVRVGNMIVENNVIRCRWSSGRSGLWFFGASSDNAVIQCDGRNLSDAVIVTHERETSNNSAFCWRLVRSFNTQDLSVPLRHLVVGP